MYRVSTESSGGTLRERMTAGAPVFGTFFGSSDPVAAERQSAAGWDFLIIDLQHGAAHQDGLVPLIMGIELGGSTALVRVPWNSPSAIMRALDCGAEGVIVPMVNNAAEAALAARSCRYPPLGDRSYGQLRGNTFGGTDGANAGVVCLVMIETAEGVENIQEILSTPGVDGAFIGPVDLALGLGLPVGTPVSHPRYVEAQGAIKAACEATDRIAGGFVFAMDDVAEAVSTGWGLLAVMPTTAVATLRALPVETAAPATTTH